MSFKKKTARAEAGAEGAESVAIPQVGLSCAVCGCGAGLRHCRPSLSRFSRGLRGSSALGEGRPPHEVRNEVAAIQSAPAFSDLHGKKQPIMFTVRSPPDERTVMIGRVIT